jgi:coenzyme F420 hydrogenase subunit beta
LVDVVVTTGVGGLWYSNPIVALSKRDLLSAAGSRYTIGAPLEGLRKASALYPNSKIGFVGLPCQIDAVRTMMSSPRAHWKLVESIVFTIAVFCNHGYKYKPLILDYLQKQFGVDLSKVTKMDIKKNRLKIYFSGELVFERPISEIKSAVVAGCQSCSDFTGEFADISVGAVGSPEGFSTVIIRSEKGEKLFKDACKCNALQCNHIPIEDLQKSFVGKLSQLKKNRPAPYIHRSHT